MKIARKNNCVCLFEIQNKLPRTKHCVIACQAQRDIMKEKLEFKKYI